MDISIIILNHKSKGFTLNCIKSIKEANFMTSSRPSPVAQELSSSLDGEGEIKYEIIVVDNNSGDSVGQILAWQHPGVKFIQNTKNLGMGAGNNVGIGQATGKYIVVMNPDTIVFRNTFKKMYDFMEANNDVGIAGPQQFNPDRTIQNSCYRWHSLLTPAYRRTPLGKLKFAQKDLDRYLMNDFDHQIARDVDWLLGSFLFIRARALGQAGLFDERFFLYFEDTDLCRRFWQKGWRVVYYGEAKIIHNHVRESARAPWYKCLFNRTTRQHIYSWFKYLRKWGIYNPNTTNI